MLIYTTSFAGINPNPDRSTSFLIILFLFKSKIKRKPKMSSTSRAWISAASVGVVEAMKDQGICRWNYALRSLHQQAKNNLGLFSQSKGVLSSSSSSSMATNKAMQNEQQKKQSEESLRKVMYLSCWGPN
ncbi:PREDICTED: uncharacterized protein LOC104585804 [Nelumbo nucifera]|uniref:Wound-responsive family protein n=2 Tax=Nelumbo nucifera TaxID=4432 RepID=A0A822XXJ5_NELNU|nr:PREDICTED: uncharacterized protein LOC104585804 [Nelumbo nucifera]DAD23911.1 TPA_asm: hypothetical protein HUJ06_025374 [Nelumbo nucifera]